MLRGCKSRRKIFHGVCCRWLLRAADRLAEANAQAQESPQHEQARDHAAGAHAHRWAKPSPTSYPSALTNRNEQAMANTEMHECSFREIRISLSVDDTFSHL